MVDYIKISVSYPNKEKLQTILNGGAFLYVEQETDPTTGEIVKEIYKYHNMRLKPFEGGFTLKGSIHKLHNELIGNTRPEWTAKYNGFNGDRFTLSELEDVIKHLCKLLDKQANECYLQNIEIGLNNIVPFSAFDFLQGVQAHRNNSTPTIKHRRNYFEFGYNEYFLKLYNKGKQYDLHNEVIRVEVKVRKMRKLHNTGIQIHTLADLTPSNLEKAFKLVVSEFEKVVNIDSSIRTHELTKKALYKLNELTNPATWQKMDNKQRQRAKEFLEGLNTIFSDNQKGQIIEKMHHEKDAILTNKISEKCHKITDPKQGQNDTFSPTPETENCPKITDPENEGENIVLSKNHPLSKLSKKDNPQKDIYQIGLFSLEKEDKKTGTFLEEKTDEKEGAKSANSEGAILTNLEGKKGRRFCPVTGVDLCHEKDDAKYIRSATFLYLKENDPEKYILLCSYLLPTTGYKPVREKTILSQLCKQVRNRYNNPNKDKKLDKQPLQKYLKNQLSMF